MNGSQKAVLWIGLILVALNLAMKWAEISSIIFKGASPSAFPPLSGNALPSVVGGLAAPTPPRARASSGPVPVA
jgi:hypothetical protein